MWSDGGLNDNIKTVTKVQNNLNRLSMFYGELFSDYNLDCNLDDPSNVVVLTFGCSVSTQQDQKDGQKNHNKKSYNQSHYM